MPPMLYHRTFSLSNRPYVNYLIKISDSLADEVCSAVDREVWNYVFEQRRLSFDDEK